MRFLQLADYITPNVKESDKGGWVNYGDDNDFFNYLIELYNNSPTNSACIRGTSALIYGQGLEAVNKQRNIEAFLTLKTVFKDADVMNVCNDYKAFGMAAFELIMSNSGKVAQALHVPMNYLRSGIADDEGKVSAWYYATNWHESQNAGFNATEMPVFGQHGNAKRAIIVIRQYTFGSYYYSTPDYIGALPWADVESEISNYHLSNLRNGMWPGMLINFNNGVPPEIEQIAIENNIKKKWGKSGNAGRVIVAFNRDKESAATIEPVQLSDAAEQFTAISAEAMQKVLLGHRITSPVLLGIKENTGLGNNAEELQSAHALFVNTVVKPMQEPILNAIKEVLISLDANLDIYFKPLTPLEFKQYEIPIDAETKEKDSGVQMAAVEELDLITLADDIVAKGENEDEILNDYELYASEWAEGEASEDDIESRLNSLITLSAEDESKQDSPIFKVRYMYRDTAKNRPVSNDSRELCTRLMAAQLIYRKEDITSLSSEGGAQSKGQPYDVFLHKGGANCKHGWERRIYRKRLKKDGTPWGGGAMNGVTRAKIYDAINGGAKINQGADSKALVAPRDTPTKGYKK